MTSNGHDGNGNGSYYRDNGFNTWVRKNALTLAILLVSITSSFLMLRSDVRSLRESMLVQTQAVSNLRSQVSEIKGAISEFGVVKIRIESLTDRVDRIEDMQTIDRLQTQNFRETLLSKGVITKKDLRARGE